MDVPDGIDWVIDEYDGLEWVAERHRRWDSHGELQTGQRAQSAVRSSDVARAESLRGLTPSERAARNERLVHEAGRQRRQEK